MAISSLLDSMPNLQNQGIERGKNVVPEVLITVLPTLIDGSINNEIDIVLFFLISEFSTTCSLRVMIEPPFEIE